MARGLIESEESGDKMLTTLLEQDMLVIYRLGPEIDNYVPQPDDENDQKNDPIRDLEAAVIQSSGKAT